MNRTVYEKLDPKEAEWSAISWRREADSGKLIAEG
jgi:hypothetical protein